MELQKWHNDKNMKLGNYTPSDKSWLNSIYIKTKQNWNLEAKNFELFFVLQLVEKQVYKFKLLKKWRMYDIFYILLLEQNITRKKRVDKAIS